MTVAAAAALIVGLLAAWVFLRRQRQLLQPMVETDLFRRPAFGGAVLANLIAIFAFSGLLFFFSQYLQLVRGYGPIQAGLAELPLTLAAIVVIALVGAVVARVGRGRAIALGMLAAAGGMALLAVAEGLDGYAWIAVALVLAGLGIGVASTVSTDAILSAVPKERAGAASSIAETAYELGIALGIAVLGSVHAGLYSSGAAKVLTDSRLSVDPDSTLAAATNVLVQDGSPQALDLLSELQHSFTTAMQYTSGVAAVLIVLGAVVAWRLIPSPPVTDKVDH